MDFTNRLKGHVAQSLIECLLDDAGLRVVPLGIEQVVREVRALTVDKYLGMGLPSALRSLPDYLVSKVDMSQTWLLEVKYRQGWDKEICQKLFDSMREQASTWGPLYVAIFLGQPGHGSNTPASFLRVAKLVMHQGKVCHHIAACTPIEADEFSGPPTPERFVTAEEMKWLDLSRIQDVFPDISGKYENSTLIKAISLARQLAGLDDLIAS